MWQQAINSINTFSPMYRHAGTPRGGPDKETKKDEDLWDRATIYGNV